MTTQTLTAVIVLLLSGPSLPLAASVRPNVLVIVADDLGYSDLGCYGGEIPTPNLDGLAESGIRLTRFYNTGRCCPSRASILTGQYPHRVGLGHMVKDLNLPGYRGRVDSSAVSLADVLSTAGYRTFISGKWHLGTNDPTQHGFEQFYGTLVSAKTFWDPEHMLRLPKTGQRREYPDGEFYATDACTDHALDFLQTARTTPDKPWFLYLAYNAPHFPLQAPKSDIERHKDRYSVGWDVIRSQRLARMKTLGIVPRETTLTPRSQYWDWGGTPTEQNPAWDSLPAERQADLARRMAIYAAMVDRMDHNIGRIIRDLKERNELDNTLILFLSDNGACAEWDPYGFDIRSSENNILHQGDELNRMGQPGTFHSMGSGWANASNTPWRLYKHFCHEGGINSPLIAHWPAGIDGRGDLSHASAHVIDIMPTLVDVAHAEYPTNHHEKPVPQIAGESMMPLLQGREISSRDLFFEHEGNRAVFTEKWKAVALRNQPWALYDVATDRTELHDLSKRHPEIVSRLTKLWQRWASDNYVTPMPRDYGAEYLP